MDVKDVYEKKEELESNICNLIHEFTKETGLRVSGIDFSIESKYIKGLNEPFSIEYSVKSTLCL